MITHKLHPDCIPNEHRYNQRLTIDVAGAGGNGSQMVTGLARMHLALQAVGHPGLDVHVFDPDTVTDSNVGRQLFSPSDVGQSKAVVLVHRINCYYGLGWSAHACNYDPRERHGPTSFLIGCVDSIRARRELARFHACYWLDLGNRDRTGQVILGMNARRHKKDATRPRTFFEVFPELSRGRIKEDDAPSCSLAASLEKQDLFINQSVTTFALQLLWSFLRNGQTELNGYFINLESGRVTPMPILPHSALPLRKERTPKLRGRRLVNVLA